VAVAAGDSPITPTVSEITGTWVEAPGSVAGYRVREELAGFGFTTAAGRSDVLSATLVFDGPTLLAADIEVDVTQLHSDQSARDAALRSQALETDRFPVAVFRLTSPIELPGSAVRGEPVAATITGDLTLHGIARAVQIPIDAQLVGSTIVVVGSAQVQFEDYDIQRPRAAIVLSVDNAGIMEFQLLLSRE
jgi:polyisoprenoid-binding protein YceI